MKNKIYDCFIFNNETDLLEIRFNILNDHVDYFVIIESFETFTGLKKKPFFNIEKFPKFKNKIIHGVINKFPNNHTAWQNESYQRNYISKLLDSANSEDVIMISDLDEIPDLTNINLFDYEEKLIVFEQRLFLYKLNYGEVNPSWHGTKCIKKKYFTTPQQIRELKTHKKYSFYRIDKKYFSKKYEDSFRVIRNGGWHFSWLGSVDFIQDKLKSFSHTEMNNGSINNSNHIENCIKNLKPLEKNQKIKLKKLSISDKYLPKYILNNITKYKFLLDYGEM